MTTITIPKVSTKSRKLVAVPRDEYEAFVQWLKHLKSSKTFEPTNSEKRALKKARRNFHSKKHHTLDDVKRDLGITR